MTTAAAGDTASTVVGVSSCVLTMLLLFGGAIFGFCSDVFHGATEALRRRSTSRHQRRLELRKLDLKIAKARAKEAALAGSLAAPAPGQCRHRKAVPVRDIEGAVVAWLCRSCEAQLPPDFSIYVEDL